MRTCGSSGSSSSASSAASSAVALQQDLASAVVAVLDVLDILDSLCERRCRLASHDRHLLELGPSRHPKGVRVLPSWIRNLHTKPTQSRDLFTAPLP